MPTPKEGYRINGVRVPSVTTIIGRFKDSGALMRWAHNEGLEGRALYEKAGKAADVGTAVHSMVETHTQGGVADFEDLVGFTDEQVIQAKSSFAAYLAWADNFKIRIIETEMRLVCEEYRYGGTPDAVAVIGNELCLLDYKTSNGVYTDMLVQLAAYRHLWNVNRPDQPLTGGSHLLRFAKTHGDFAHHYYPDLKEAWEQFVYFRKAYEIDKELKKRAA